MSKGLWKKDGVRRAQKRAEKKATTAAKKEAIKAAKATIQANVTERKRNQPVPTAGMKRGKEWYEQVQSDSTPVGSIGCWHLKPDIRGVATKRGRPHVDVSRYGRKEKVSDGEESTQKHFPFARATPFMMEKDFKIDAKMSASHLCHDELCVNPGHVVMEPQWVNVSRTFCTVKECRHEPRCLADGTNGHCVKHVPMVFDKESWSYKPASN